MFTIEYAAGVAGDLAAMRRKRPDTATEEIL